MKTKLLVAATALGIAMVASAGIAVNAATLSSVSDSGIGRAPEVLMPSPTPFDDHGGLRPDGDSDDPTPSPSSTPEAGDDGLPRHSGEDERPGHDAGDDNPTESHSGSDSSGHDSDDDGDHSGSGHDGSDDDGDDSGDDSGHGGHGSDD